MSSNQSPTRHKVAAQVPMRRMRPTTARDFFYEGLAGAILFNFFYQTGTEAAFWLGLALAWLSIRASYAREASPAPLLHSTP